MGLIEISAAVVAVTLVVLAGAMVPAFIEIRKAAISLREFANQAETDLKPILKELRETLAGLKIVTEEVATKVDDVQSFMEAVGDTGRNIRTINTIIGSVAHAAASSSIWITGARAAGKFVLNRITKKRG